MRSYSEFGLLAPAYQKCICKGQEFQFWSQFGTSFVTSFCVLARKGWYEVDDVLPKVRTLLRIEDPPAYLMIHCSGNDIAGKINSITLRHEIEADPITLSRMLPNTTLVWSQILPRLKWRDEDDHRAVYKIRRRINSKIATFVMRMGVDILDILSYVNRIQVSLLLMKFI
ncbi:hypothetical protein FSP39_003974 [Pinctada imbricata]|uniref:Uncharacterized protein n=1 Tax=Pinctada imbricata TaxID=66713 RepID=A0AA88XTD1_PINIB|nr:hypothetical protein FSP39_003974 [Pinctada imbricata]